MRTFYQYVLTYRGQIDEDHKSRLAEWIFEKDDFPKQSTDYDEISEFLEYNSPFYEALKVFDQLWETYIDKYGEQ